MATKEARAAVAARREEIKALLPDWAHELNLHRGVYRNRPQNLQDSFCEWLDAREPGLGEVCLQLFGPLLWKRTFAKVFPQFKPRGSVRPRELYFCMEYVVTPKTPRPDRRIGVCPTCHQQCLVPIAPKSKEDLIRELRDLDTLPKSRLSGA